MGMSRCGRRLYDRGFSNVPRRSWRRHETSSARPRFILRRMSRTIEDRCQSTLMLALPVERATYGGEGLGQRKDLGGDEQVGILGAYRMPIDAFSRNCYFRHQVCTRKCDALRREAAQRNAADHPVFLADVVGIEEAAELLSLGVSRHCRGQSHPKSFGASAPDPVPCTRPCALSPTRVRSLWRPAAKC